MNRQEAIEVIERHRWSLELSHGSLLSGLVTEYDEAIKALKRPASLVDFLGWEVGVEYKCLSGKYKIACGELLHYCSVKQDYKPAKVRLNRSNILTMKQAKKVEHKKKYRIPLPHLTTTDGMIQYLTERDNHWFASRLNEGLKQEWTEDELCNIPNVYRSYAKEVVEPISAELLQGGFLHL